MSVRSVIVAIFCASMFFGKGFALRRNNVRDEVVRYRTNITDHPQMDFSNVKKTFEYSESLNFVGPALEKRAQFSPGTWQPHGPGECLQPASGASPLSSDCAKICHHIHHNHTPMIIGPLEIEHWQIGFCIFEVANLLPCETIDVLDVSLFYGICNNMYVNCGLDSLDGYVSGEPPLMGFALSGLPAAPPYQDQVC